MNYEPDGDHEPGDEVEVLVPVCPICDEVITEGERVAEIYDPAKLDRVVQLGHVDCALQADWANADPDAIYVAEAEVEEIVQRFGEQGEAD